MTIRAHKPEFNFREKLKELDYSHVPYEKMPAGSVIQVKTLKESNNSHLTTTSSSWVTMNYEIDFYPKFANSLILFQWSAPGQQPNTAVGASDITVFRSIDDGTAINLGHSIHGFMMIGDFQEDGFVTASGAFHGYDSPNTTSKVTYSIYGKTTSSGTAYIAHGSATRYFSVMEIRQSTSSLEDVS